MYHEFLEYVALGWIRPDKLPVSFQMRAFKDNWFEFFRSISNGKSEIGNYQVNAGVFKSYNHLERYTLSGIKDLKDTSFKDLNMAHQIKPSVTNPTIADIYEKIDNNRLILSPDFQRKFVWTQDHQEQFLDTILHGYPFPEIYVCQGETDTKKLRTTQKVIDGQQRLTTIKNYIENDFKKS